jgi:hypothetical protein
MTRLSWACRDSSSVMPRRSVVGDLKPSIAAGPTGDLAEATAGERVEGGGDWRAAPTETGAYSSLPRRNVRRLLEREAEDMNETRKRDSEGWWLQGKEREVAMAGDTASFGHLVLMPNILRLFVPTRWAKQALKQNLACRRINSRKVRLQVVEACICSWYRAAGAWQSTLSMEL